MGSGYRGDFGQTKGSKNYILASSKKDNYLSVSLLYGAPKNIKEKASKSPISIPNSSVYKVQKKNGYKQITFKFEKGGVKYESRWHEKTPNSPNYMKNSWQVTKTIKGKGYGNNVKKKEVWHMIKNNNGKIKWISNSQYQEAIRAKKNGTLTDKQREVLNSAHWRD